MRRASIGCGWIGGGCARPLGEGKRKVMTKLSGIALQVAAAGLVAAIALAPRPAAAQDALAEI